jgi:hypothetical protein
MNTAECVYNDCAGKINDDAGISMGGPSVLAVSYSDHVDGLPKCESYNFQIKLELISQQYVDDHVLALNTDRLKFVSQIISKLPWAEMFEDSLRVHYTKKVHTGGLFEHPTH